MLVGYVSDEQYVAIADVAIEFSSPALEEPLVTRSTPRGEVFAALAPAVYTTTLVKPGFGSKTVSVTVDQAKPHQFRLLSDRLLGYMFPLATRSGKTSEFRVHSVTEFQLSLWRYGWEKEFIQLIGWYDEHGPRTTMQTTPDGDYAQTGVEWNKTGYGNQAPQLLTAPEKSGLYYLHARNISGDFFAFPWVVAPAEPAAPMAVLASTNTWNAYNNFGGRSNYINATGLPNKPTVNARQDLKRYTQPRPWGVWSAPDDHYLPLSFDRPDRAGHLPEDTQVTDGIGGRLACVHAPGEWRLLGWLERQGFAYDLYSDMQLHAGELPLDAYKVLILSVHPEYWSREMFSKVRDWVHHHGGRLLYLGGNGLNCEVVISDNGAMRCLSNKPGPEFESRMHRTFESEATLLGVVFSESGIMTAAPYRVIDCTDWIFAGTNLGNGDLFGTRSLHERIPGGASGHETDKISASSPQGIQSVAKGINPDNGGAEIVHYETRSGGAVFSAGSITYVSSLLVDSHISRITANVLSRYLS